MKQYEKIVIEIVAMRQSDVLTNSIEGEVSDQDWVFTEN